MKFTRLSTLILLAAGLFQSCLDNDTPMMAIGGSGWKEVAVADKAGNVLWQHPLEKGEECNTVALLEGDKLLYSTRGAAKVVDRNHDVLWEYKVEKVRSCTVPWLWTMVIYFWVSVVILPRFWKSMKKGKRK